MKQLSVFIILFFSHLGLLLSASDQTAPLREEITEKMLMLKGKVLKEIVKVHHPKVKKKLVKEALEIFFDIRKVPGMKKKPSTSELIDWLKLLMADDIPDEIFKNRDPSKAIPPLYGALVKNEQDVQLLERLAFMARREGNSN